MSPEAASPIGRLDSFAVGVKALAFRCRADRRQLSCLLAGLDDTCLDARRVGPGKFNGYGCFNKL
jgi:hypothetical protein